MDKNDIKVGGKEERSDNSETAVANESQSPRTRVWVPETSDTNSVLSGSGMEMVASNFAEDLNMSSFMDHSRMIAASSLSMGRQLSQNSSSNADRFTYVAPETMHVSNLDSVVEDACSESDRECVICHESLNSSHAKSVSLRVCGHVYHYECIKMALEHKKQCPLCNKPVFEPQGRSPSGIMEVTRQPLLTCQGYPQGTLRILYHIPGGIQRTYHEHPGTRFSGTSRMAFLPDCTEGRALLERLKYAFQRGLVFTVGTSLTTGRSNTVTWTSIHHKTNLSGGSGAFGYPDPDYFMRCHEELDFLGVPTQQF